MAEHGDMAETSDEHSNGVTEPDDVDLGEIRDELPADLDPSQVTAPYLFPNNSRRKIPAVLYTLILWRGERVFAMLNAFPYTSGHLMVLPMRAVEQLAELDEAEHAELWHGVRLATQAVEAAYAPHGINVGANLGRGAGAGIPDHLHVHVLPRWDGDTNFMTAIANTRVMPESLAATWERLHAAWPST